MSYTLVKEHNKQHSHIEFNGVFQGKTVIWDTHFFTLKCYNAEKNIQNSNLKQLIDIQPIERDENTLKLTVALNIDEINNSNILKMMIMIKQYKNLSFGRHKYG